ncbi:hypothetical protein ECG_09319 [Echinococcus granulosus]|nr:hypothetical protein ECG_09319 [Echinococcus granulosus]
MSPFGVLACRTVCLSSPSLMNGALLVHNGEAFLALLAVREELGRIWRIANCVTDQQGLELVLSPGSTWMDG